jgi:hypothetical protein
MWEVFLEQATRPVFLGRNVLLPCFAFDENLWSLKWHLNCQVLEIIYGQIVESWSPWCTQYEQL